MPLDEQYYSSIEVGSRKWGISTSFKTVDTRFVICSIRMKRHKIYMDIVSLFLVPSFCKLARLKAIFFALLSSSFAIY